MVGQIRQFIKTQTEIEPKHTRSSIFLRPNKDLISYIPYNIVNVISLPEVWPLKYEDHKFMGNLGYRLSEETKNKKVNLLDLSF